MLDRMKLSAFKLYAVTIFMLLLAYVLATEPTEYLQVELFDELNKTTLAYNPNVPDLVPVYTEKEIATIPVQKSMVTETIDDEPTRGRGWKRHWNKFFNLSSVLPDTSFEGTNYTNYSKETPLKYDGIRNTINN